MKAAGSWTASGLKLTSVGRHSDDLPQRSHPLVQVGLRAAHQDDGAALLVGGGACREAAETSWYFLTSGGWLCKYYEPGCSTSTSTTKGHWLLAIALPPGVGSTFPQNSTKQTSNQTGDGSGGQLLLTWDDLEQVLPRVVRVQRQLVDFAEAHGDDALQSHKQTKPVDTRGPGAVRTVAAASPLASPLTSPASLGLACHCSYIELSVINDDSVIQ